MFNLVQESADQRRVSFVLVREVGVLTLILNPSIVYKYYLITLPQILQVCN